MRLIQPIQNVFVQLKEALSQLSNAEYKQPSDILFNATVGQHIRHIIELFQSLEMGYETGIINYENRKRDMRIETEKDIAVQLLNDIYKNLDRANIDLVLETEGYQNSGNCIVIPTNYYRELAYNLEHVIHHMALIRIGITEVSGIRLPENFGVAFSTLKYRQQCAL